MKTLREPCDFGMEFACFDCGAKYWANAFDYDVVPVEEFVEKDKVTGECFRKVKIICPFCGNELTRQVSADDLRDAEVYKQRVERNYVNMQRRIKDETN